MTAEDPSRPQRPNKDEADARLSREEVDAIAEALRQGVPEKRADTGDPDADADSGPPRPEPVVLRFDLIASAGRRTDDLPGLQLFHDRFALELAAEFKRTVGSEGVFVAAPIERAKFAEVHERFATPSALAIADFVGIGCPIIIAIEPELVPHFVDLLMGGTGGPVPLRPDFGTRGFTPAEQGLVAHVATILGRALGNAWSELGSIGFAVRRVATDPRHAVVFDTAEPMVVLGVEVQWGVVGTIQLIFPAASLAPFSNILGRTKATMPAAADAAPSETMRANLALVEVELKAILGTAQMTVGRLLTLQVGDVVRLGTDPEEPILVRVEDEPILRGFPTARGGNVAVEILGFINADESGRPDPKGPPAHPDQAGKETADG